MQINKTIPGQLSEPDLREIARLASFVPKGGVVVETGSLFGLSSWTWAKNVPVDATVYCIDPWYPEAWIQNLAAELNTEFGVEPFKKNTADCHNIILKQGYSPQDFLDWTLPVDLYFDDSVHTNPELHQNITFWTERLRSGGVICGHDYANWAPDVIAESEELAKKWGATLVRGGDCIWSIMKPPS